MNEITLKFHLRASKITQSWRLFLAKLHTVWAFKQSLRICTVDCQLSAFMYKSQPIRLSKSTIATQKTSQSLNDVSAGSRLWIYMVTLEKPGWSSLMMPPGRAPDIQQKKGAEVEGRFHFCAFYSLDVLLYLFFAKASFSQAMKPSG